MKLRPTEDRILIKPLEAVEYTDGGIALPGTAQERPCKGTVVAVGPGKLVAKEGGGWDHMPMFVNVGEVVLYSQYAGDSYSHKGEDYLLMKQTEARGIFEEE